MGCVGVVGPNRSCAAPLLPQLDDDHEEHGHEDHQRQRGQVAEDAVERFQGRPVARRPADVAAHLPPRDAAQHRPRQRRQAGQARYAGRPASAAAGRTRPEATQPPMLRPRYRTIHRAKRLGIDAAEGRADVDAAAHPPPQDRRTAPAGLNPTAPPPSATSTISPSTTTEPLGRGQHGRPRGGVRPVRED